MTYFNFTLRNLAWVISISLMCALVLALAACGDSETEGDATLPSATVPPTVAVAATQPPTEVPTETPEPPRNTLSPTQAPTNTPAPTQAPEPTPVPTVEPTATPEPLPETYPLEIRDMMGRPVTIPAKPARIVSISPTATEMLYIAGGTAVARDSSSTFPPEVLDLPELGGAYSPSFEAIAAQRADLILIEALSQARFLEPLMQFGVPVVAVRATSLDDITTGIQLIGQIIEMDEQAEQAAQEVAARVESSVAGVSGGKSALILISDADRNLYAAKPQSYPGAIASMFRLTNPAADLSDSGAFPGFALISGEQLFAMNPDYLFTITPAPEPAPRLSAMLPRIPGFSNLGAIASGQMHELDHVIFLRNQGPRIAEAVEAMAELVGGSQ
ncbi:MAG: ABC transporter substrate-binding protein [Chloroflexi bacterium]|nr:ABC transporter substrate-binding protein [Chloroflexota bacterium]MYE39080.1 ABC transporter substrate-binding protein [Chloroflexota bacterium]